MAEDYGFVIVETYRRMINMNEIERLEIKTKHTARMCQGFIEALDEINKNGKVSKELMENLKKELSMMIVELI